MAIIQLPTGGVAVVTTGDAEQQQRTINRRHEIVVNYCREKGWPEDPAALSIAQIMEIRRLSAWREAGRNG